MQTFKAGFFLLLSMAAAPVAFAYIGPGSGISLVGSLLGLLVTILLAVGAVIIWPYRRMLRKRRQKNLDAKARDNILCDAPEIADKASGAEDGNAT